MDVGLQKAPCVCLRATFHFSCF